MDLRTFRRNGPGLAECESEAAWRRLWGDRRAHRSLDTRGPVSNVAASWPQFGYRGQTHSTLGASRTGKVSGDGANGHQYACAPGTFLIRRLFDGIACKRWLILRQQTCLRRCDHRTRRDLIAGDGHILRRLDQWFLTFPLGHGDTVAQRIDDF